MFLVYISNQTHTTHRYSHVFNAKFHWKKIYCRILFYTCEKSEKYL